MAQGLAVRRCAEQSLLSGATVLRVDLRHCTHADSTFLGTLLFLKRLADREGRCRFTLVSPSPSCCQILRQMGLDAILPLVTEEAAPAEAWTELPCGCEDVRGFQGNVVQAHKELAALPGPAGDAFRAVSRRLTQELEAEKKP
jgi:anti-anti-sigma regulatory factor